MPVLSPRRSLRRVLPWIAWLCLAALGAACGLDADDDPVDLDSTSQALINERNYSVSAGLLHSCALQVDGTVQCWGRNNVGQLGDGTTTSSATPVTVVGITTAVAVTSGYYHSCAALLDGTARCWGHGAYGQLGNNSTAQRLTPVQVTPLTNVTSLSAGGYHTCASRSNGQARCWGYNAFGQVGNGATASVSVPNPVGTPSGQIFYPLTGVSEVETGAYSSCARLTTGHVRCWGRNQAGQIGDGTLTTRTSPAAVTGLGFAQDLSVGDDHVCAVVDTGRASCWGLNSSGQLGDGTTTNRQTPVEVKHLIAPGLSYSLVNISAVGAGRQHTCVRSAGRIWCMGSNSDGQLGQPASAVLEPLAEQTPVVATEISGGGFHTCARRPGGQVVCFGQDTYGQVGEAGTCPSTPTATLIAVTAPNDQLHLQPDPSGPLYYVAGDQLDIALETTACATVSEVLFVYGPIEGGDEVEPSPGTRYEILSMTDRDDGVRELTIRIHFTNMGTGSTYPVGVTLTSPDGNSASVGFTLSEVEAVNAHGGITNLSRAELFNEVLVGMFEKWGDANYFHRYPAISLYDLDYASMTLHLDSAGIVFHFRTKADVVAGPVGDLCNPTVDTSGRFQIVLDASGVAVTQWIQGPDVSIDFPVACDVLSLGLAPIGAAIANEIADNKVAKKINDKIGELDDVCGALGCAVILNRISHVGSTLQLEINPLYSSVTFRRPYTSNQIDANSVGDPMRRGIAIPTNDSVVIMAGGVASICRLETGPCNPPQVGAAGLFNWNWDPNLPIPDPWPDCGEDVCPELYYPHRYAAWIMQQGLRRDLAAMPMPSVNPGAVIHRVLSRTGDEVTPSNLTHAPDMICRLDPTPGADAARVVIGRNDIYGTGPYDNENGTGDALITIGFAGPLATAVDPCAE